MSMKAETTITLRGEDAALVLTESGTKVCAPSTEATGLAPEPVLILMYIATMLRDAEFCERIWGEARTFFEAQARCAHALN